MHCLEISGITASCILYDYTASGHKGIIEYVVYTFTYNGHTFLFNIFIYGVLNM